MILSVQTSNLVDWRCRWHVSPIRPAFLPISCDSTNVGAIDVDSAPRDFEVEMTYKSNGGVFVQVDAELELVLQENILRVMLPITEL